MTVHRWRTIWIAAAALLAVAGSAEAQRTTLTGQIRPRVESRDPVAGGSDSFTSMRVRLGVEAELQSNLSVFIQAQDVRIWGEETDPLADFRANNFDVHQAYFRYEAEELDWLTATVGRMETSFGGERLVGAVDWAQQGQAFDGVRLDLSGDPGMLSLVAYTIGDLSALTASENRQLYGAYANRMDVGGGDLDLYWLYQRARNVSDTDEHAFGGRWAYDGDFQARVEATLERGTRADADVSAFMIGGRVGTELSDGQASVTLWYDYLSGDDPTTPENEAFNTFYATNHKFYGFADIFTNIPLHTAGAGLQDIAAKLGFRLTDEVNGGADFHRFQAAELGTLSGKHFADELDLWLRHSYSANLAVEAGFSYVVQNDPLAEVGRLADDQTWLYLMFDAVF